MSGLWGRLLDLLYPPRCILCGRLLDSGAEPVCPRCRASLPAAEGGRRGRKGEFFDRCVSPLYYTGVVRESFHRYKFQGRRWYAETYGRWMADCVRDELEGSFELITWAPLSARRRRQRGYDQAELLARAAAACLGREAAPLLEKRHIPAQSGLEGAERRRANVLGAYRLRPGAAVEGKRILLVDDVITTGSTLSECARVLKTAGAAGVVCVTLAQTMPDGAGKT